MSPLAWLVIFFFVLLAICITVYVLVVKYFYWGAKDEPRERKKDLK